MSAETCTRLERQFVATGSLIVVLVHHRDHRSIAAMAGRVIAAELRRIEPGRNASVEKEGISAAEAVAEKTGKLVKAHPALGNDKMHLGRALRLHSAFCDRSNPQ